jgi:hypothetical protein
MLAITMKSSLESSAGIDAEFTEPRDAAATQLARIAAVSRVTAYSRPVTTNSNRTMSTKPKPPLG